MSEELKPCPICGGPAELWKAHEDRAAWVACMGRCAVFITNGEATTEEAIAAWNTRTPPKVKALVWELTSTGYEAKSPLGYFDVFPATRAAHWYWRHEGDAELGQVPPMQRGDDADEAKAAAQADFERRVHACLEGYDEHL